MTELFEEIVDELDDRCSIVLLLERDNHFVSDEADRPVGVAVLAADGHVATVELAYDVERGSWDVICTAHGVESAPQTLVLGNTAMVSL